MGLDTIAMCVDMSNKFCGNLDMKFESYIYIFVILHNQTQRTIYLILDACAVHN